jgi:LPXTG-site transpeptidase (sortase) family protein
MPFLQSVNLIVEKIMSRLFKSRFTYILITSLTVGGILLSALGLPQSSVKAEASLSINPLTWNVVGLDSNKVTVGPENFPVGVRVCNAGPDEATNVTATFVWDDGKGLYFPSDDYINLRADSLPSITIPSLGDDECYDYYFEVAVTRNSASYDKTRRYHIEITADGGISLSTPRPREIFVERLVSQSRNYTLDVRLDGQSIPAGGTMAMAIGNTYEIQLVGSTATNGYEQLETFINFPNTIFQVNSVVTTFSANGGTDPDAASKLYADGCRWENDPNSPNYRACLGTGKYGGNITVTYNLTIIADEGSTQTLNTLIYDFSGSSYHYNADYSIGGRIAVIIDPTTSAGFAKRFIPSTIANDGISTLRFTITNPHPVTVSGYKFDDTLPGAIVVADLANIDNGCGGTVTALPDSGTISLTGGELAPNTSCTILVDVTAPYDAGVTYPLQNLVDLYVGDAASPAATATAPLTVTATQPPPLTCQDITNQLIAQWSSFTLANNPTHPPTGPLNGLGVTTAAGAGLITTVGTNRWVASNVPSGETLATARTNNRYYEFVVNTAGLDNVNISFQASRQNSNGPSTITLDYGPAGSLTQGAQTWGPVSTNAGTPSTFTVSNLTNLSPDGNTYFRFYVYGASNPNIEIRIHDMSLNGSGTICTPNLGTPPNPPTLSKQFAPDEVRVGEVSTLTFAITNPNASDALSGITFRDELPAGMTAVAGTFVNSGCSGIWGLESGNPAILLFTGGALAGNISCTLSVNVVSTSVGPNLNISDPIDSTETLAGNSATDTLNVLPPPTAPVIFKQFDPNPLLDPAGSTTLTFRITNTDPALAISGVAFTDTLPTAPVVMQPVAPFNYSDNSKCGSGYSFTWNAGTNQLAFSGGAIAAGATCEIDVDVEVPGVDISGGAVSFLNQTSTVSHVFNGTAYQGNDAEATLVVDSPNPALNFLKQVGPADTGPWSDFLAVEPLGNVYYRFVVENTGDVALNNIIVADNVFNISGCIWVDGNGNTLADTDAGAPGVQFTLPVADADEGHLAYCVPDAVTALSGWNNNTASANSNETEAAYPAAYPVSSTASYATTGLTLDKSTSTVSFANENNPLSYSYLITNTGSAPLKGPVVVTDNKIVAPNEVTCQDVADAVVGVNPGDGDNFLDPGESVTCTATYLVTADDVMAGSVTNTAYAVADSVQSNNDSVTVAMNAPALTVAKSSTTTSLSAPGTVTYSYLVTNTGSVTLTGISLSDDNDNDDMSCPGTTLAVGASMTCSATHTFTQAELDAGGNLSNTVTASSNEAPDATDSLDIPIVQNAAMTVAKSSTTTSLSAPGTVTYSYLVTNTGSVTLTGISLSDDNDNDDMSCPGTTLAVGASMTCSATHTFTQAELDAGGNLSNTVTASSNEAPDATDSLDIPIVQNAAMTVAKSSTTTSLSAPGTVTYSYLVTNTGSVTLTGISLSDDNDNDDMSCPGTTLAVGASMTCSATHTFTQAELDAGGNLSNTVTASSNEAPDATDSLDIPIMQNPALNIEKLTNGQDADVPPGPTVMIGDPVAWTYVVTNTGNVALTNVTVTDDKGVTVTCPQTTLAVAESMTCTASGTAQLGQYANIGTVTAYYGATLVNDSDASHYFGTSTPLIGAAKRIVGTPTLVSPGTWEITYEILVRNYGEDALSKIQITDNLAVTFPPATAFAVQSLTSANFAVNWPGYTGSTDTNLLAGTDTLNVGASGTLTLVVRIVPAAAGPFQNTAIASGQPPSGDPVNDSSHNGTNPDPDNDGNPTNNNAPTPVTFDASIFDPPFGIKVFDDSGLPLLRWRMVWINESNLSPLAAQVSDPIPVGTTFAPSGAPNPYPFPAAGYPAVPGSTNVGVSCQRDGVLTTTANCYYEGPSGAYLRGRIIWVGTFGPDLGNFTEATAQNELVITYNVTINDGVSTVRNVATLDADLSTDGDFEDPNETGVAVATSTWSQAAAARTDTPGKPQPKKLPATGFAPGIVSKLPLQPLALVYSAYSDLKVEIPSLKVKVDIVGVPVVENQWDITWLGANAGYLDGTAFPTWVGNSVITGHVYLSNGLPGPFVNLSKLKWGDRIVIHAYGQKYIYEVRSALTVRPEDTTVLGHKDRDWVTLITCKEFDETSKTYKMRTAVQAVLISVIADRVEEHGGR